MAGGDQEAGAEARCKAKQTGEQSSGSALRRKERHAHANGIKQLEPKAAKNGKGVGAAPGSYRAVHTRNN